MHSHVQSSKAFPVITTHKMAKSFVVLTDQLNVDVHGKDKNTSYNATVSWDAPFPYQGHMSVMPPRVRSNTKWLVYYV